MERRPHVMSLYEMYTQYHDDIESMAFCMHTWCMIFDAKPDNFVRFTTDSADHFDTESVRELQRVPSPAPPSY